MKEDRYEFDMKEWQYDTEPEPFELPEPTKLIVTRKKPKVKVEWGNCSRFGDGLGENGIDFTHHGYGRYHIVQFRVTGWDGVMSGSVEGVGNCEQVSLVLGCPRTRYIEAYGEGPPSIYIGSDAKGCWSQPVLLPESVYSRLDEITKALEDRANGGKG